MSTFFSLWVFLAACLAWANGKPSEVVYFPDPQNEGQLIPGFLEGGPDPVDIRLSPDDVRFYLVTGNFAEKEELIIGDLETLEKSSYIKNAHLKVMSHGFGGTMDDGFPRKLAEIYLNEGKDVNIILIDWRKHATSPWYNIAVGSIKMVGNKTADLIKFLVQNDYASLDDTHIIGFSLGGHVVGNIGLALGGKAARITSLDPALPLFDVTTDENRIDPSDAQFVDVIHTAGGYLWENGIAFFTPRGHVDFYPNNGRSQPGCQPELFGACSHQRAPQFFEEAQASPDSMLGCPCEDWKEFLAGNCNCDNPVAMGQHTPTSARGSFFFRTRESKPYGLGQDGAKNE